MGVARRRAATERRSVRGVSAKLLRSAEADPFIGLPCSRQICSEPLGSASLCAGLDDRASTATLAAGAPLLPCSPGRHTVLDRQAHQNLNFFACPVTFVYFSAHAQCGLEQVSVRGLRTSHGRSHRRLRSVGDPSVIIRSWPSCQRLARACAPHPAGILSFPAFPARAEVAVCAHTALINCGAR